jgi:DNA polymerase III delta prime subunit
MNLNKQNIPFVEKYRPTNFDDIVLDPTNKIILSNVIKTGYFPNFLFFGPPGTGKTTTIINLINNYQEKYSQKNKEHVIHLNASDERGIEIIRSQINTFVTAKTLFNKGTKFVILDEVDYMTKNAQQALKYLIQNYSTDVRFCLICNYISKIDESLQNDFLKLRFNQLPENEIISFLKVITINENIDLNEKSLKTIQKLYKSDIRSMINLIQTTQNINDTNIKIISSEVWYQLIDILKTQNYKNLSAKKIKNEIEFLQFYVRDLEKEYNIDKKSIIKDFANFLMRNYCNKMTCEIIDIFENIIHSNDCKNDYYLNYFFHKIKNVLCEITNNNI